MCFFFTNTAGHEPYILLWTSPFPGIQFTALCYQVEISRKYKTSVKEYIGHVPSENDF